MVDYGINSGLLRYSHILDNDTSNDKQGGQERVIAYYSKTLTLAEWKYCVTRKELLATVKVVKHFQLYFCWQAFTLAIDHSSLIWLYCRKKSFNQVARWLEILAEIKYRLEHRTTKKHSNSNDLSQQKCENCWQFSFIKERDGGPFHKKLSAWEAWISNITAGSSTWLAQEQANKPIAVATVYKSSQRRNFNGAWTTGASKWTATMTMEQENFPPVELRFCLRGQDCSKE